MITAFDQTPEMREMDLEDPEIRRIIVDGSIAAARWVRENPDRYQLVRRNYGLDDVSGLGCITALIGAVSSIATAAIDAQAKKRAAALAANIQAASDARAIAAAGAASAAGGAPGQEWYTQWYVIAPAITVGGLVLYAALKR
jgi:hypothetical protein